MACVNQTQCLREGEQEIKNASNYTTDSAEILGSTGMPEEMRTPIQVICAIIILIGIAGNVCVIVTVIKKLHTPFYYCLASLALCDTLSLSILPILPLISTTGSDHSGVGEPMWFFIFTMQPFLFVCSVTHTLAVTVERYTAICWPFIFKTSFANSKLKISLLIAFIWVSAFIIAAPYITMIKYNVYENNHVSITTCSLSTTLHWHEWYDGIFITSILAILVIAVLILSALLVRNIRRSESAFSEADKAASTLRQRNKKRDVKIIMLITTMFIMFMLPVGFMLIANMLSLQLNLSNKAIYIYIWFARICTYLNSTCNPLIYSIASPAFRKSFVEILVCGRRQGTPTVTFNT